MKARYLGLRVPPDQWREIQMAVAESGLTQAMWLRAALSLALEQQRFVSEVEKLLRASESRLGGILRAEINSALAAIEIVDSNSVSEE